MPRWSLGHHSVLDVIKEIEAASPRVAVIVGVSLVDECLTKAIRRAFRPLNRPEDDRLLGERGSMRDFAVKIDLGYAMSIYGPITYSDLHTVRKMRNDLAHKTRIRDFRNASIKGPCLGLKIVEHRAIPGEPIPKEARRRFLDSVAIISDGLLLYANRKRHVVRVPNIP